jgi:hypothetical protein
VTVQIEPMPPEYLAVPPHLRPIPPPIFPGGQPTQADRELALELWRALDAESRRWYVGTSRTFAGLPLTAADLAALEADQ